MKKSFLILLSSILAVFLITGCADDTTSNNGGTTTPPTDPAIVEQIKQFADGYYEIKFFYTDGAGLAPISSDCTYASDNGYHTSQTTCYSATTKGYAKITVDNNGGINLATKIQMDLKNSLPKIYFDQAKDSQYNYTVYPTIPASAIDMSQLATGVVTINKNNTVKGTSGRDLSKNVSDAAATYSFDVTLPADTTTPITIKNTMITTTPDIGLPGIPTNPTTNVIVEMSKITALPADYTMDVNTKFPEPVIEGFATTPAAN